MLSATKQIRNQPKDEHSNQKAFPHGSLLLLLLLLWLFILLYVVSCRSILKLSVGLLFISITRCLVTSLAFGRHDEKKRCTIEAPRCHRQRFQPLLKENRYIRFFERQRHQLLKGPETLLAPKAPASRGSKGMPPTWEILQIYALSNAFFCVNSGLGHTCPPFWSC